MTFDFTPAVIVAVLGAVLSFLAVIVPGFNAWWMAKPEDEQKAWQAIAGLVVALGVFGLACTGWVVVGGVACVWPGGFVTALSVWVAWMGGTALGQARAAKTAKIRSIVARR